MAGRYNRLLEDGGDDVPKPRDDEEILTELVRTVSPSIKASTDESINKDTDQGMLAATDPSSPRPISGSEPWREITTSVRLPEDVHQAIRRLLVDETRGGTLQGFLLTAAKAALADPKLTRKVLAQMPKRGER